MAGCCCPSTGGGLETIYGNREWGLGAIASNRTVRGEVTMSGKMREGEERVVSMLSTSRCKLVEAIGFSQGRM